MQDLSNTDSGAVLQELDRVFTRIRQSMDFYKYGSPLDRVNLALLRQMVAISVVRESHQLTFLSRIHTLCGRCPTRLGENFSWGITPISSQQGWFVQLVNVKT